VKILVADDDRVSRRLVRSILAQLGHEVVETENGLEAWRRYRDEYFPVVVSDWMMPELDGLEVCRSIRQGHHGKYTYVILVTSLDGKPRYLEGMNAGADDFLRKPIDRDELAARLGVAERMLRLQEEVKALRGLLSACMYCRKVREGDVWVPLEQYVSRHSDARFSHGICPECMETRARPDMARARKRQEEPSGPDPGGQPE
jgi:CheY-like chemotaxis protein